MTCATAYNVLSAAKEHAQSPIGLYVALRNPVAIPSRSLMMEFFPTSKTIQYAMILAITDGREITLRRTGSASASDKTSSVSDIISTGLGVRDAGVKPICLTI